MVQIYMSVPHFLPPPLRIGLIWAKFAVHRDPKVYKVYKVPKVYKDPKVYKEYKVHKV